MSRGQARHVTGVLGSIKQDLGRQEQGAKAQQHEHVGAPRRHAGQEGQPQGPSHQNRDRGPPSSRDHRKARSDEVLVEEGWNVFFAHEALVEATTDTDLGTWPVSVDEILTCEGPVAGSAQRHGLPQVDDRLPSFQPCDASRKVRRSRSPSSLPMDSGCPCKPCTLKRGERTPMVTCPERALMSRPSKSEPSTTSEL